ncbi:helix-turn-helix transcriptional regulator [bacterium]|nr:helix-turn-helix transcriptional regulator [bacterium]
MNDETLLKTFGMNIKFERLKRKLSQEKVAEALEVSAVYISNVESGKHSISLVNANKFANFYEKPLDYLLTEKV